MDAGERGNGVLADFLVVVDADHGDLFWDRNARDAEIYRAEIKGKCIGIFWMLFDGIMMPQ